ncbi:hypothetical protein F511_13205 [Dorcoceras hygrometricum]|uniref:Uncharacterized protein n=1 Tax=Dorcoceras hygrometricum TaxID=472368 RepID=A0A2Z7APD0_9LAMI|nr:hypothetical protein F511_13205 [Dorcoceras hygrometricum]
MDRIGDNLPQSTEKSRILVIPVGARHKCQRAFANFEHESLVPDVDRSKQISLNLQHSLLNYCVQTALLRAGLSADFLLTGCSFICYALVCICS